MQSATWLTDSLKSTKCMYIDRNNVVIIDNATELMSLKGLIDTEMTYS